MNGKTSLAIYLVVLIVIFIYFNISYQAVLERNVYLESKMDLVQKDINTVQKIVSILILAQRHHPDGSVYFTIDPECKKYCN